MPPERSEHSLLMVAPLGKSISMTERLALSFLFFVTGDANQSLRLSYLHLSCLFMSRSLYNIFLFFVKTIGNSLFFPLTFLHLELKKVSWQTFYLKFSLFSD